MTHKIKIVSLLMVLSMLFFIGCKKNNTGNETNETSEETFVEQIPEETLQLLDNCPSTNYQDPSVFGFNGKSDKPLDNLFGTMCNVAMRLTNDTKYIAGGNPVKEPEQKGLAYVYGYGHLDDKNDSNHYSEIKDYRKRRRGYKSKCNKYLHGIDCAGFIAHVMDSVGIKGKKKSLFQMKAWQQVEYFKSLKSLETSQYTGKVSVKEFNNVSVANIENGDILYKITAIDNDTATHIGIVFKRPEDADLELTMFQSSGRPYIEGCTYNLHENDHGPIQKKLNNGNLNDYFEVVDGHSGYARVLRIIDSNWVDLGLPSGILWATRNVGANSPEESGYYFAWGETQEKSYYDWIHYNYWTATIDMYGNITNESITKYNENDHLTTLQSVDDAATSHWSHLATGCRMPTYNDWDELITKCPPTFATRNGVKGVLFTAENGNSLFLPAVGFRHEGGIFDGEHYEQYDGMGFYWTSSRSENNPNNASYVRFKYETETPVLQGYLRLFGLSVRPVRVIPSN